MAGRIKRSEPLKVTRLNTEGTIKIGQKSERGYPMALDYFTIDPKNPYAKLFHDAYGEKPSTIQIVFPRDEEELVCTEFYELRDNAGKLVAEGDGYEFRVFKSSLGEYQIFNTDSVPNLMEALANRYPKSKWTTNLRLTFRLALLPMCGALFSLTTKGAASSVNALRDAFDEMKERNGKVSGVIFDLSVKIHTSNAPGKNSRYPVLSLTANECRDNVERVLMAKQEAKQILIENT